MICKTCRCKMILVIFNAHTVCIINSGSINGQTHVYMYAYKC